MLTGINAKLPDAGLVTTPATGIGNIQPLFTNLTITLALFQVPLLKKKILYESK